MESCPCSSTLKGANVSDASRHVPLEGGPREDPEHAGGTMFLRLAGHTLETPQKSSCTGVQGESGLLCLDCCPCNLSPDKAEGDVQRAVALPQKGLRVLAVKSDQKNKRRYCRMMLVHCLSLTFTTGTTDTELS